MRQILLVSVMVVGFLFALQFLVAAEPEKGGPCGPESLFSRLDANHDGVISGDEMSADAPEPLKALLKAADRDGDKTVSQEEFTAALKEHPLPRPPFGMRGEPGQPPRHMPPPPPPSGMPMQMGWMPIAWMPIVGMPGNMPSAMPSGMPGGMMPPPPGNPAMGFAPHGMPHAGPAGRIPDPNELFHRFDKDNDGNLTLDEFTEGMKQLHKEISEHARPMAGMPGPGRPMEHWGPGPAGPQGCPAAEGCPFDKPAGENRHPDFRRDGHALDARIEALEAKLKNVEAKLDAK